MSSKPLSIFNKDNQPILRMFAAFLIGFFLITTVLTALVAVPEINRSIEALSLIHISEPTRPY